MAMRRVRVIARTVVLSLGLVFMFATAASADSYTGHVGQGPQVPAAQFGAPSAEAISPGSGGRDPGTHLLPASSGSLAFTGADIAESVVIGVGAIGVGIVLVRLGRRRHLA